MDDEASDIPHEWEIDGINAFRMTLSMEIAQKNIRTGGMDLGPTPYKDFAHVFNEDASKRLSKQCPWDHAIDLKPREEPYMGKAYPIDNKQRKVLNNFID